MSKLRGITRRKSESQGERRAERKIEQRKGWWSSVRRIPTVWRTRVKRSPSKLGNVGGKKGGLHHGIIRQREKGIFFIEAQRLLVETGEGEYQINVKLGNGAPNLAGA